MSAPTPPADDVREALAESLEDFMQDWYDRWAGPGETWAVRDMAASIVEEWLPEVRPHGTVTDAEVEAAAQRMRLRSHITGVALLDWEQLTDRMRDSWRDAARDVLTAAMGACS